MSRKREEADEEQKAKKERREKLEMYGIVALSLVLAVGLLMAGSALSVASLSRNLGASERLVTVLEAVVKLALFLAYMFLISRLEDIQRDFYVPWCGT